APALARPCSQRTCAEASVACPQRSTSTVGVNQRRFQSEPARSRNAVSARFISAAMPCRHASSRGAESRQTAAGLPAKGRSVNASTWKIGSPKESSARCQWAGASLTQNFLQERDCTRPGLLRCLQVGAIASFLIAQEAVPRSRINVRLVGLAELLHLRFRRRDRGVHALVVAALGSQDGRPDPDPLPPFR